MFLKKIYPPLQESIEELGFTEPMDSQNASFPEAKAGKSFCLLAGPKEGKTTSICLAIIQKLKEEKDDVPRAIIVVKDTDHGLEVEAKFNDLANNTSLRVHHAIKGRDILRERDDIYLGMDVVIATAERLNQIYLANGMNYTGLQIYAIDAAHKVVKTNLKADIDKFTDRLTKCQIMLFAEKKTPGIERFMERYLEYNLYL